MYHSNVMQGCSCILSYSHDNNKFEIGCNIFLQPHAAQTFIQSHSETFVVSNHMLNGVYIYIGWTTRWWVIRVNDSRRPWSPLVVIVTMVFHCFSISLGELTDLLLCTAGRRCVDPQWMHLGTSESAGQARGYLKIGLWWSKQEGHGSRRIIKIALKDKKQILFLVYFRTTTRWATYFQESFNWAF